MTGPGSMSRYVAAKRVATHDALRAEVVSDHPVDLRQVERDLTDFHLDRAFADYAATFGVTRAITKAIALIKQAQIAEQLP